MTTSARSLIQPFNALRPAPGRAGDVIAPPYDVLSTDEARERASGRPWSFLHISKSEIDLAPDISPYAPEVYAKAAQNLHDMIGRGVLVRDAEEHYYVYRITMGEHTQTGLVAAASVADYDTNRIRKHEFTRPDKEDDRVRQIDALNAQTGPVLLAYPAAPDVDAVLAAATMGTPDSDADLDGVRHTIWVLRDSDAAARITTAFYAMPALYIADGHHRSAAASRIAAARRESNSMHTGAESYNAFLAVIFPAHEMRIMDYNRLIVDLNRLSVEAFLSRITSAFTVEPPSNAVKPTQAGTFGMYLDGQWYRLSIRPELIPNDPVASLDVSLLQNNLIAPILGIDDPRRDKRIDFVGGIRGLSELKRRVDSGEMAVAFAFFPTGMADLMAVADANEVMPPKSTWFEPKLADGLVSHVLD
ncbi:MAG: DUF1015 domain-containing protein [Thiobacillus sp.]